MQRILFITLLLLSNSLRAQHAVGYILEELPEDSVQKNAVNLHNSLRPQIRKLTTISWQEKQSKSAFQIKPLVDLNSKYADSLQFRTGAGALLELNAKKWYFRVAGVGGLGFGDSTFSTNSFYREQKGENYAYADVRSRLSFTPNSIFNFQLGLDNNFIGQGNRSLLLSDYSVPYPFAQIRTKFWRVEYTVLYQFFREKFAANWQSKNAATHYLSLNFTKWLNVGIFETVIFRPKDTLLNRGYDVEYLNPVIFYRPQEYALGSSDNVIIGLDISARIKKHTLYGQFVLDEFNLPDIKNKTGWWANKFGVQGGAKGRLNIQKQAFFYRLEYNFMRPYTYAHIDGMQNYGHQSTTLAHPYGANFHEILLELKWQNKRWQGKLFASYYLRGLDKDGYSYGGNIYQPYTNRPHEYGHFTGQGRAMNGVKAMATVDYKLFSKRSIHGFMENHVQYNTISQKAVYYPVVGIRSMLWNDYRNY